MLKKYFAVIVATLLLYSCSEFSRIQKSDSYEERFKAAEKYYEEEEYYKAGVLYESILASAASKKEAEIVQIKYAYCQYYQKQYNLSGHYFRKFVKTYPKSTYVEEAYYMYAMSLYKISPVYNLDQSNTKLAIDAFQTFLNKYPNTTYKELCNERIDMMQHKLEHKAYDNAKLQMQIGHYKAAVIDFENFRLNYPDSDYNEELQFLKIKSQYELASISMTVYVEKGKDPVYLKRDRFNEVKEFYFNFVDRYPQSEYINEAETIYKNTLKKLSELEL